MTRKCPDFVKELNDYLDGTLDPQLCQEIDAHLGDCQNCRIMIDTLRQTVKLCQDGKEVPLPARLEEKLNGLLKARWEKKFGHS
jgi:predicted anti-sigma-YlaC factor YlaD